jgi:hypothetical protein
MNACLFMQMKNQRILIQIQNRRRIATVTITWLNMKQLIRGDQFKSMISLRIQRNVQKFNPVDEFR